MALAAVVLGVFWRGYRKFVSRRLWDAVVSLTAAIMYVFCLWIPGRLQAAEVLDSKISSAGIVFRPDPLELDQLALFWALELLVVFLVELGIVATFPRVKAIEDRHSRKHWQIVAVVLIIAGFCAYMVFPVALESRGLEGQGLVVLLRTALVCGLAVLAYFDGFGLWRFRIALFAGTFFLILENVRSPLAVIVIAYVCGLLVRGSIYRLRIVVAMLCVTVCAILAGTFMSEMRANSTRGEGRDAGAIVAEVLDDPADAVYGAGIDTLDGYRFAREIAGFEPARPADLFSPVTTFIPRSLWPEKPRSVSVEVSSKYLGYKASGQFLSPIGYLRLTMGSYVSGLLLFAVIFGVFAYLAQRLRGTIWFAILMVVVFRFLLGGSMFDVYYGLVLVVILSGASLGVSLLKRDFPVVEHRENRGLISTSAASD
ncbi:hypothetical protein [Prescottella sp. D32]|uniref:hypothetical protein n=1 Tax=Prescottella sp. D32 TaxID=3029740 RepID=UPI003078CAAB